MTNDADTQEKPQPGTGHQGRTFLVGEHVYISAVEESFAETGMSWMHDLYPKSVDNIKKWIEEDYAKEKTKRTYLIVRKSDDRAVGSIEITHWRHTNYMIPKMDPLFGSRADVWEAEAWKLIIPWLIDEQHRVVAHVDMIPADKTIVIDALESIGCRQVVRYTEGQRRGDGWVDILAFDYPNKTWMETLGSPFDIPLERTGTGDPRPVIAPVTPGPHESLPPNAMKIGPRVYLRPLQDEDADQMAKWFRRETESFWSLGRGVGATANGRTWFRSMQEDEPQEEIFFAVCLRSNQQFIGAVGLSEVNYQHRFAESVSEIYRPDYRGGGFGSEAKHLMFDYAFNDLGLHSITSWVLFKNTRSAAALRKQGYRDIGRACWFVPGNGGFENFAVFELLADTWRAMPRQAEQEGASS